MNMGHILYNREGLRRRDGSPIPNINSAFPKNEFLSQATDCPLKSLVYYV